MVAFGIRARSFSQARPEARKEDSLSTLNCHFCSTTLRSCRHSLSLRLLLVKHCSCVGGAVCPLCLADAGVYAEALLARCKHEGSWVYHQTEEEASLAVCMGGHRNLFFCPDAKAVLFSWTHFSPFQKHREEEEEKKKRADAEAAQVYEEFVASFGADDAVPGNKGFVRGGVVEPGSRPSADPIGELPLSFAIRLLRTADGPSTT